MEKPAPSESDKTTLKDSFTMWYHSTNYEERKDLMPSIENSSTYLEKLTEIATFKDKKIFWKIFQHLAKPTELNAGIEYHIFKEGIKPCWEDERNKNGGRLSFLLTKNCSSLIWEEMALSFIGGTVPCYGSINGICISVKKAYDVAQIWFDSYERTKIHNK